MFVVTFFLLNKIVRIHFIVILGKTFTLKSVFDKKKKKMFDQI